MSSNSYPNQHAGQSCTIWIYTSTNLRIVGFHRPMKPLSMVRTEKSRILLAILTKVAAISRPVSLALPHPSPQLSISVTTILLRGMRPSFPLVFSSASITMPNPRCAQMLSPRREVLHHDKFADRRNASHPARSRVQYQSSPSSPSFTILGFRLMSLCPGIVTPLCASNTPEMALLPIIAKLS